MVRVCGLSCEILIVDSLGRFCRIGCKAIRFDRGPQVVFGPFSILVVSDVIACVLTDHHGGRILYYKRCIVAGMLLDERGNYVLRVVLPGCSPRMSCRLNSPDFHLFPYFLFLP